MPTDKFITTSEARKDLYSIIDRVSKYGESFTITHHGKKAAIIVDPDEFESWLETASILKDKNALDTIKKGDDEIKSGETIPLDDIE